MIYEVQGDILKTSATAIVLGVAINDQMKQGLSFEIHNMFPQMHKDFHKWCHQSHPKVGTAWSWDKVKNLLIINLITQEGDFHNTSHPKRAKLTDVNHSLKALKKIISKEKVSSVAIPKIATGGGGLLWEEVYQLIQNQLEDVNIPIYIYIDYIQGVKAEEP